MRKSFSFILILLFMTPALLMSYGKWRGEVYSKNNQPALEGYDTVAYFTEGKAVKGDPDISYSWKGVQWHFSSRSNRDMFMDQPEQYAPQYGGYCAWAMGKGNLASVNPEVWLIHEDKLFLNYSRSIGKKFNADLTGNINKADREWNSLLKEKTDN